MSPANLWNSVSRRFQFYPNVSH